MNVPPCEACARKDDSSADKQMQIGAKKGAWPMNVPAIRAALERLSESSYECEWLASAVVRVGLRACDDVGVSYCGECGPCVNQEPCAVVAERVEVIADILREAGVEVVS